MCVSVVCAGLKFVFGYRQWFEIYAHCPSPGWYSIFNPGPHPGEDLWCIRKLLTNCPSSIPTTSASASFSLSMSDSLATANAGSDCLWEAKQKVQGWIKLCEKHYLKPWPVEKSVREALKGPIRDNSWRLLPILYIHSLWFSRNLCLGRIKVHHTLFGNPIRSLKLHC